MERMSSSELPESERTRRARAAMGSEVSTSGRNLSGLSNSSPVDFEQAPKSFNKQRPGQHQISIGKPDKNTVDLLEEVPLENQLYLEYTNVRAWVPAMAPGGASILPSLPKLSIPAFKSSASKQTAAPAAKDKMRQVQFLLALSRELQKQLTGALSDCATQLQPVLCAMLMADGAFADPV